jgi:thiamine pyrophosphokinase
MEALTDGSNSCKTSVLTDLDFIPEIVTDDLDSINPVALQQCPGKGAKIFKNPDQNSNDFTKALNETAKWQEQNNVKV